MSGTFVTKFSFFKKNTNTFHTSNKEETNINGKIKRGGKMYQ